MTPENVTSSEIVPTPDAVLMPADQDVADAQLVGAALMASRSPGTLRTYASYWRGFVAWCEDRDRASLPADPDTVARYIAARAHTGMSASGVGQVLASISYHHQRTRLPDPTTDPLVVETRKGLRRGPRGTAATKPAHAVTVEDVHRIVAAIDTSELVGLRDRALILLGFATGMRRSELGALMVRDLEWKGGDLLVTIRVSKGDQEGAGQVVGVVRGAYAASDPVEALHRWLVAADALDRPDCAVFAPINKGGNLRPCTPMSGHAVGDVLIRRADAAGLSSLSLTAHSLRAGLITAMIEAGASLPQAQRVARHKSVSTTARYARGRDALEDSPVRMIGL
ncbi:integrase [Cellulomonas chitinilytica]|uniref:Integrase n=1 Tax=Cellulomonas chitinilytica TaxID=398759 RepID=A0A919P6Y9_9CELL|nr:site-specific integrase [Cellulomonas chitinilytica]GIG22459.1 integrase [Cellulomonas chitinilytica]